MCEIKFECVSKCSESGLGWVKVFSGSQSGSDLGLVLVWSGSILAWSGSNVGLVWVFSGFSQGLIWVRFVLICSQINRT